MVIALLIFIFIRPFIASLAFPFLNQAWALLLLGLALLWFGRTRPSFEKEPSIYYPLTLFIAALLISTVFAQNKTTSFFELYKYINGAALLLLGMTFTRQQKLKVIRCLVSAAFVISMLAAYQYFFGFRHLLNYLAAQNITDTFTIEYITSRRVFFPFVTPNIFAGYMAMLAFVSLYLEKGRWLILPLSLALVFAKSLSGLASFAAGLGVYLLVRGGSKKKKALAGLGLLGIMTVIMWLRMATLKQHLHPAFSTIMRLSYWHDTLKIIGSHLLVGIGPGNFILMKSRFAHNSYLQIWAETGIGGIVCLVWLVIAVTRKALKQTSVSTHKNVIAALLAAHCAFLAHNLFDFSFFLPEVSCLWWLIMGMLVTDLPATA